VCAVVAPDAAEAGRREVLAGLERQRRPPDALAPAPDCEWLWLLDGTAVPEPDALAALLEALEAHDALPEPVLLASKVVGPDGSPHPAALPVPAVGRDLTVAAVRRRLLAIRAARPGSLLVHRGGIERCGPPPGGGDDLVWSARVLRDGFGALVPGSVAVRATPGAPPRVSVRGWARLLVGDALTPREKPWFAFRLAEDAWAGARGRAGRRAGPGRSRPRSPRSGA
jgi:rhamnopyranosyl-N-acetylglucosaminyl-diphospho-decaprenol beta-1,3/1,4-galactofuranosyltransferase